MPTEHASPAAVARAARRFFPWVPSAGKGLRNGPVYLFALSRRTVISRDGDYRDRDAYYLHRALMAIAPSYAGAVRVGGKRLGRPGPRTTLSFSTDGADHCTVRSPFVSCRSRVHRFAGHLQIARRPGWRIVETELRIGRTGCFRLTATGLGLRATIPLAVPGPDWGTPGW
jgi:hypothetical protein